MSAFDLACESLVGNCAIQHVGPRSFRFFGRRHRLRSEYRGIRGLVIAMLIGNRERQLSQPRYKFWRDRTGQKQFEIRHVFHFLQRAQELMERHVLRNEGCGGDLVPNRHFDFQAPQAFHSGKDSARVGPLGKIF